MLILIALKLDPRVRDAGRNNPPFATAARRALLLYLPFTDFNHLTDIAQIVQPAERVEQYDPTRNNDNLWWLLFHHWLQHEPHLFPDEIHRLVQGIEEADFDLVVNPDDQDEEPAIPEPPQRQEQEWERLARLPANRGNVGRPREFLGHRDVDLQHDWATDLAVDRLTEPPETFVSVHKRADAGYVGGAYIPPDGLNNGQRLAFNHIVQCFENRISDLPVDPPQQNMLVMGTAGVGKSFLIRTIESEVWRIARTHFGDDAYPSIRTAIKLVAFTGKAAFQVGGVTIHSLLSLKNDKNSLEPLSVEQLRQLQRSLKNTHFLFVDEMSMVGLRMLRIMDSRLREAFPANREKPFGGITVVMFGDFAQLPPVLDTALFHRPGDKSKNIMHEGSKLYRDTFTRVFHLQEQMRQRGHTEMDLKFATLLTNLRSGRVSEEDWRFMQSRVLVQLPQDEVHVFENDALALFPTNELVRERNLSKMELLQRPVARFVAKYIDIDDGAGVNVDERHAGGLQHELFLCVGARVRSRFWTWLIYVNR
jgi:ATP-dependent DNA helicase PIF1